LNRGWQPLNVTRVHRALVMLCNEVAHAIDPATYQTYSWSDWARLAPANDEPCIRTLKFRLRIPEVIVLTHYDRLPVGSVAFNRRNLFKRDRFTCQYCGVQPGPEELSIDHVVPRSQGGASSWTNCVLACVECNKRKADRSPREAGLRLRSRPVQPSWKPTYASHPARIDSWKRFVSEAYWNVQLGE
jgi:5-methylcytosine-specific restriction endonuclease McrA